MVYLAEALSQPINPEKIEVYRREFERRGVPLQHLKPMFLAACDLGFLFFPSVDQLLAQRPRDRGGQARYEREMREQFKRENADGSVDRAREQCLQKLKELCGLKSFPEHPELSPAQAYAEGARRHQAQMERLAEHLEKRDAGKKPG